MRSMFRWSARFVTVSVSSMPTTPSTANQSGCVSNSPTPNQIHHDGTKHAHLMKA
jgi:hypothetical protein